MLKEILMQNLRVLFVGTNVTETSDELGFYYLGTKNKFWEMLEYSRIAPTFIITQSDRKALVDAKHSGVLTDVYKQFFFEKKETALLNLRIGLTDLNRRLVVSKEDDPSAEPTSDDIQKFVKKIEKYKPKVVAFVTSVEVFEKCLKPLYPAATRQRGKQEFMIGTSEVWLIGSTSGRVKDTEAMEQVFEDLAERLNQLTKV
jgi:G:T/U-mismatch repair DNA glycosylase